MQHIRLTHPNPAPELANTYWIQSTISGTSSQNPIPSIRSQKGNSEVSQIWGARASGLGMADEIRRFKHLSRMDSTQKPDYKVPRRTNRWDSPLFRKKSELEPQLQIAIDEILDAIEIPSHEPPQLFEHTDNPDPSPRYTVQTHPKDASDVARWGGATEMRMRKYFAHS